MQNTATVFEAIRTGDLDLLQRLVASDPSCAAARDAAGVSALTQARYAWRMDMVEALLSACPPLDVFEAAMLGNTGRLEQILAMDPGAARHWSPDGFTALHLAAFFGQPAAAEKLVAAGADTAAVSRNALVVAPLHSAVAARHRDIAALVLAHGADPNARQTGGWTALHSAAHSGDAELVELLLVHGADPRLQSDDGRDAAAMAVEKKLDELARRLGG